MLTGENGILTQAQNAKEQTEIATEKEAVALTMINREMSDDEKYNVGEKLVDKKLANGNSWKIVYVDETKTTYGTGWYYVGTGANLENYGETKHSWVINNETGEIIQLPEEGAKKYQYGDNLAVKDSLILNADPINMDNNSPWGEGVTAYGIEEGYGWNGADDYIEVYPSSELNIKNELTFEFYGKSDSTGYFPMLCKTLKGNTDVNVILNKFRIGWRRME